MSDIELRAEGERLIAKTIKEKMVNGVILSILGEVQRAETLHPHWPSDIIHAVAIIAEESGEAIQSALDNTYGSVSIDKVKEEIIHTAATCIRALVALEE